jgi:general secretion pathway protein E/type IV pilus assembly protein PilB
MRQLSSGNVFKPFMQTNITNDGSEIAAASISEAQGNAPVENTPAVVEEEKSRPKLRLGEALIERGLISKDQLQVALTEQKNSKKMLGSILVDMSFITESVLSEILAESSGTTKFDPKAAMLDSDLVRKLPKEVAMRHKIIPVGISADELQLAMSDVYNVIAIDQVRRHFPRSIKVSDPS